MSTDHQQPDIQIPGVRYVKRDVYDVEATTLDGETTYREVKRTVRVPAPPRDWDLVLVRGLVGCAFLTTALSLSWSTVSIGGLLARSASEIAAYSVAVVFDAAWLSCGVREWLDRRDPDRAKTARRAGWAALILTMAAITAHGVVANEVVSGLVGATVSALAKAMWSNVLGYYAVPLDDGMAHHLLTRRRRIAVKLALGPERRRLAAMEATEQLLYGGQTDDPHVTRYEASTPAPMPEQAPASAVSGPVSGQVPPVSAAAAVLPLVPEVTQPVPAPAAPVPGQAPPVSAPVSGQPTAHAAAPAPPVPPVPPVPPEAVQQETPVPPVTDISRPSIASIVRKTLAANPKARDAELLDEVKKSGHPDRLNLADTVRRTARRIDPTRKAS